MVERAEDMRELRTKVQELETLFRGLKIAAGALGLTGAVLLLGVLWVAQRAAAAVTTADTAKAQLTAKSRELDAQVEQGRKSLVSATTSAKLDLQSFLRNAVITPEKTWRQEAPAPVPLGVREGEGVCFLTRVTGNFQGSGEMVRIDVVNGEYLLVGSSSQHSVAASARCLRFTTPNASS